MLVQVHPVLIKRQKQHFHHLESLGVDIIFGCNGLVWVGCHIDFNPDAPTAVNVDGSGGSQTQLKTRVAFTLNTSLSPPLPLPFPLSLHLPLPYSAR